MVCFGGNPPNADPEESPDAHDDFDKEGGNSGVAGGIPFLSAVGNTDAKDSPPLKECVESPVGFSVFFCRSFLMTSMIPTVRIRKIR